MALSERLRTWIFSAFLLLCVVTCISCEEKLCNPGLRTKGYTEPRGDIILQYGKDPLNITCVLNDEAFAKAGPNASQQMYFARRGVRLPADMVQIVDEKSIRLYIKELELGHIFNYDCMIGTDSICNNFVIVGKKPVEVTDFECVSYNLDNLTCTWTDQYPLTYVKTEYTLHYELPSRYIQMFRCPMIENIPHTNKMRCVWTPATDPIYRQVQRQYMFYLTVKNKFGEVKLHEEWNHFRHVISGPPVNLSYLGVTTNSILLSWTLPITMKAFPVGLDHRILYQCQYGGGRWRLGALITDKANVYKMTYNLTVVAHPHVICDVRVSMRTKAAHYTDEFSWSKNSSLTVRLASAIPEKPPETNVGGFEILSSGNNMNYRMVYVYWNEIPVELYNGPEFQYHITVDEDTSLEPSEGSHSFAKFDGLSVSESYTFKVWSRNSNGTSDEYSVVRVPRSLELVAKPRSFTKVEYDNGVFELSWEHPKLKEGEELESFTIFWCDSQRERPHQCSGILDWVMVPANLSAYNVTLPKKPIYQFAISANSHTSSSGMLWASCTVIFNRNMNKMQNVWISRVDSTYIELTWKLDCSERFGPVEGYVINYCPILRPKKSECKPGEQKNQTVRGDSTLNTARVEGLSPYTTYMLTIAVMSKHSNGSQQHSDPLQNTTREAAPSSPPMNFTYDEVTNSSISLHWGPPLAANGRLSYYYLLINDHPLKIDPTYDYKLVNLQSYENYSISIKVCTQKGCSDYSFPPLQVTTLMGSPGIIEQPSTTFQNNSLVLISWKPPKPPRGKVDFYEVQIIHNEGGSNYTLPIKNVTTNAYAIDDCGQNGNYNSFYINVRAVNLISGKWFVGPWSATFESYCRTAVNIWLIVGIVVGAILLVGLAFVFRKIYIHVKVMLDVQIKLPPGLSIARSPEPLSWSSGKLNNDPDLYLPAADEEMLLTKIQMGNHQSGESSGCSSAHESVTGSIKSTSHLSDSSDSGTEQHPRSSMAEELQNNAVSVRVSRPSTPNKGYVSVPSETISKPAWNTKELPAGNYCVLGVDPATNKSSLNVTDPNFEAELFPSRSTEDLKKFYLGSTLLPETLDKGIHTDNLQMNNPQMNNIQVNNLQVNNKGYVTVPPETLAPAKWSPKPMPTPAGNYCVLGDDPSPVTDIHVDNPYVPITGLVDNTKVIPREVPTQSPPSPLLSGAVMNKSANPGYVPHTVK